MSDVAVSDAPVPDAPVPDAPVPDAHHQGLSCTTPAGQKITSSAPLVPGKRVTLKVYAHEETWVMGGIAAGPSPQKADFTWRAKAETFTCNFSARPHWYCWRIPRKETPPVAGVLVPSGPGPYTLGFMAGAEHDNWTKGHIVFTCVP